MMALPSRPFCPHDGRQADLWYLAARWRYTTHLRRLSMSDDISYHKIRWSVTKPFQALSVPGPGADLPRDVQKRASVCRSTAMTPKMACELQGRVLADELFHPVERARRIRGMRL